MLFANITTLTNVINITGRLIKKRTKEENPILIEYYKHQKQKLSPIIECEGCDLNNTNGMYSGLYKSNCIVKSTPTQTAVIPTHILFKCQMSKLPPTSNSNIRVNFSPNSYKNFVTELYHFPPPENIGETEPYGNNI